MQSTRTGHSVRRTAPLGNPAENWHGFYSRITFPPLLRPRRIIPRSFFILSSPGLLPSALFPSATESNEINFLLAIRADIYDNYDR